MIVTLRIDSILTKKKVNFQSQFIINYPFILSPATFLGVPFGQQKKKKKKKKKEKKGRRRIFLLRFYYIRGKKKKIKRERERIGHVAVWMMEANRSSSRIINYTSRS